MFGTSFEEGEVFKEFISFHSRPWIYVFLFFIIDLYLFGSTIIHNFSISLQMSLILYPLNLFNAFNIFLQNSSPYTKHNINGKFL